MQFWFVYVQIVQVIGLDANGYGRILGQCQFGSKLFYCMWETVAREHDPFICMNLIAPMLDELTAAGFSFKSLNEVHNYIDEFILGKENEIIHMVSIFCKIDKVKNFINKKKQNKVFWKSIIFPEIMKQIKYDLFCSGTYFLFRETIFVQLQKKTRFFYMAIKVFLA